ncbi:MAG: hypothetical protein U0531_13955 [Dehalococcoidia bacterium]
MNAPGLTAQDATPATGGVREIAAVLLLVQAAGAGGAGRRAGRGGVLGTALRPPWSRLRCRR